MTTLTELARTMHDLLTTTADPLASQCGFVTRKRKVTGANFAQAVVFTAMADAELTKSRFQAVAAAVGLNASRQAIDQRFNADFRGPKLTYNETIVGAGRQGSAQDTRRSPSQGIGGHPLSNSASRRIGLWLRLSNRTTMRSDCTST
jgi:hypothetical protein